MAKIDFGGVVEDVVTREEFPVKKAQETLRGETIAIIGYGVQGPAQALNLRDHGIGVIIGQRKESDTWKKAVRDGFKPGRTLFPIEEALDRATIVLYLVSDAAQKTLWPIMKPRLKKGGALCFSHGFSVVFKDQTGVIPPPDVDVILVAPKGSGTTVRLNFLEGRGINSSFAVFQDASGKALDRTLALGIGVGSGYLFPTTFEKEVVSDLTGERGVLMGAVAGIMEAQYNVLRRNGHSPSEAFNETVEEATQSLYPLIGRNGMDWMYANCSTTAQRGALDWRHKFREATEPVFTKLYESVRTGTEARVVIEANSAADYAARLRKELDEMASAEMWRAGRAVRSLRPENQSGAKKPVPAAVVAKPPKGKAPTKNAVKKAVKKAVKPAAKKPAKKSSARRR